MRKIHLLLILFNYIYSNSFSQGIAINVTGNSADSTALLDVDALGMNPKGGVLFPRMTTIERDQITAIKPESLLIYNTTTHCFEAWNANYWVAFGCLKCSFAPESTIAIQPIVISENQIDVRWSVVSGAYGYLLDVATDSNFTSYVSGYQNLDVKNNIVVKISNLSCGIKYYYRVRTYNDCGISTNSNVILARTLFCPFTCGTDIVITHTQGLVSPESLGPINYKTVSTKVLGLDKCWIAQNLGATNQATKFDDATNASAGWYWQFNRKQGYKVGPSPTWTIPSNYENSDWTENEDPCSLELGIGWRVPTRTEWEILDQNGGWNDDVGAYNSVLKLHDGGVLDYSGSLVSRGSYGVGAYWSSNQSISNDKAYDLHFYSNGSYINQNGFKLFGRSIRCVYN